MSAPHPLNQAVIAQALYDLRNGQLRRCKAMGFSEAELDALKHPAMVSVLANANVSWCSVSVNREVLGLPKRKGRHPVLDEKQDVELWRRWKALTSSRNVDLEDETSILDAAMDLAEGMDLPLSVVWAAIKSWVDQGLG